MVTAGRLAEKTKQMVVKMFPGRCRLLLKTTHEFRLQPTCSQSAAFHAITKAVHNVITCRSGRKIDD